jgi:tape measure domain-containing protein
MATGHRIGTITVDLDLNPKRYMKAQQTIRKEAENGAQVLEKNFKNLGMKSGAMYDLMRAQAEQSYRAIVKSGKAKGAELVEVEAATARKIEQINRQQYGKMKMFADAHVKKTKSSLSSIRKHWIGASVAIYASWRGMYKAMEMTQSIFKSGMEAQMMTKAFGEISGGAKEATKEFEFLRKISDELGQNFWDLQKTYKGVLAAGTLMNMESEKTHDIFYSIVRASATLGLTSEKTKLSLYAVEQMMSKGTVTSEELRRQLGDNLPGAFGLAAQAMNMTTGAFNDALKAGKIMSNEFLPKFADVLKEKFSGEVAESIRAVNKWNEAWTDLKVNIANSGFLDDAADILKVITETIKDPAVQQALTDMANSMLSMADYIKDNKEEVIEFAKVFMAEFQDMMNTTMMMVGWLKSAIVEFNHLLVVLKELSGIAGLERANTAAVGWVQSIFDAVYGGDGIDVSLIEKLADKLTEKASAAVRRAAAGELYNPFEAMFDEKTTKEILGKAEDFNQKLADLNNAWKDMQMARLEGDGLAAYKKRLEDAAQAVKDAAKAARDAAKAAKQAAKDQEHLAKAFEKVKKAAEEAAIAMEIAAAWAEQDLADGVRASAAAAADMEREFGKMMDGFANEKAEEFNDLMKDLNKSLEDQGDLFDRSIFGDGADQNLQNMMVSLEKIYKMYDKLGDQQKELAEDRAKIDKIDNAQDKLEALKVYHKKEKKYADEAVSSQLAGYGQLFGTLKGFFDENSKARQIMHMAEMAFAVAEIAIQAQKALVQGVGAVLTQGQGEPYTAWARIAAMAAVVAGFLSMIGVGFGGGGGGGGVAPIKEELPSTVLGGDAGDTSSSIINAFEIMTEQNDDQLYALYDLKEELQDLNQNIMQFVVGILKGTFSGGGFSSQNYLIPGGQTLSEILEGGGLQGYERGPRPEFGFDEGQYSDFFEWWDALFLWIGNGFKEMEDGTLSGMDGIFAKIGKTFIELAIGLGTDVQDVLDYTFGELNLDLTGLSESEIEEAVTNFFSSLTDTMAEDLWGEEFGKYQNVGEGMFETVSRLVVEKETLLNALEMTGQAFEGTATEAVHFTQALIDLAGTFEELTEDFQTYYEEYLTDAEKHAYLTESLGEAYAAIGVEMPATRQGFKDLISSLDLTTEEGQKTYVALMALAGATDAYYDAVEAATQSIIDAKRELTGTTDSGNLSDIENRYGWSVDSDNYMDFINAFLSMSEEEIMAYAEAIGVSTEQLVDDIMFLAEHFGYLGDAAAIATTDFAKLRDQIESTLFGISGSFGGGSSAANIMSQITGMQSIPMAEQTGDNLLAMSNKLVQWYNAAVAEAQNAAREEQDAANLLIRVADRLSSLITQIDSTIRSIKYSNLNISLPNQKAISAQGDYDTLLAAAQTGGVAEVQEYLGFAQTYLQQQQNTYKSSTAYQDKYTSVMSDMEAIKGRAEAGGYDAAILAELTRGNAQIEVDLSAIQATFSELESWILNALHQIEVISVLRIIWEDEWTPAQAAAISDLLTLVQEYGWDYEATITFIGELPMDLFEDLNEIATMAGWIASESGGWESSATISFIRNVAENWEWESLNEIMHALGWVREQAGSWTAGATIGFIAGLFDRYGIEYDSYAYWLGQLGVPDDAIPDVMAKLIFEAFQGSGMAIDDIDDYLTSLGITDSALRRDIEVQLVYNLHASGDIATEELADWAYAKLIAASTESVSNAYDMVDQVMALIRMFGVVDNSGNVGSILYQWSELARAGFPSSYYLGQGVQHVMDYAGWNEWAEGGVVSSPSLGWVGEAGYPEAIIPMKDGMNIPVKWVNGGSTQEGSERPLNIVVEVGGQEFNAIIDQRADDIRVRAERRKVGATRIVQ